MMNLFFKIAFLTMSLWSFTANAIPYDSIDPTTFGTDLDGDGYFAHAGSVMISFQGFDAFDTDPNVDLEFGFFFESDPGSLITIFDSSEPVNSSVVIDFSNGAVVDIDDGLVESFFTPSANEFGLYLSLIEPLTNSVTTTVFSDPALNGGVDLFGAFDLLLPDVPPGTFAGTFFDAPPGQNGNLLFASSFVTIQTVSVSEASSFVLLLCCISSLLVSRRRYTHV